MKGFVDQYLGKFTYCESKTIVILEINISLIHLDTIWRLGSI